MTGRVAEDNVAALLGLVGKHAHEDLFREVSRHAIDRLTELDAEQLVRPLFQDH